LRFLDGFAQSASREELQIADEIIAEHDEYLIQTGLSQHVSRSADVRSDPDASRRSGLTWMTALARVELGAMLAGFTSHQRPFQAVGPSAHDKAQYGELLVDGYRTHYLAFQSDPAIAAFRRIGLPFNQIITNGRRMQLLHRFREAVAEFFGSRLTLLQQSELLGQEAEVRRAELAFLYCFLKRLQHSSREQTTITESLRACPPMLNAAMRDLGRPATTQLRQTTRRVPTELLDPSILLKIDPSLATLACP